MGGSRVKMRLDLEPHEIEDRWKFRTISVEDTPGLGKLMLEAYRGTIDYDDENLENAVTAVRDAFRGKYGDVMNDCSFAIDIEGRLASASIITLWQGSPLLSWSLTHRKFKNQGMATFLLKKSINALITRGYKN